METENENVWVEIMDDGLFMAHLRGHDSTCALGETEEEACSNLLERFEWDADSWADADEYALLSTALF